MGLSDGVMQVFAVAAAALACAGAAAAAAAMLQVSSGKGWSYGGLRAKEGGET
jgi:hypothetical protein